jgi:hypothetical protein
MGCSPNPWEGRQWFPWIPTLAFAPHPTHIRAWLHVLRQATGNYLLVFIRAYSVSRAAGERLPECAEQTRGRKPFKR